MKKLTLLITLLSCTLLAHAQHASIKGAINDTINKQNLSNTVIALLHAKDSIFYKFTRSDKEGKFNIPNIAAGNYIMVVMQDTYADYVDQLTLTDTTALNLGTIPMTLKANLLQEVIVHQQIAAMRMKGDTLEYAADSFKVQQGASVEEMLKKLPGIQVDKDGKITAQGEKVQKVLVDGEEFFGDDPTLATRNIEADAIDKVQVFDKKSDQATFTGIDDGEKTKTINLKLKANKRQGYFGKLDLASDMANRWNNTAMINKFQNKLKLSAYGITSSTGKVGLDWDEQNKYGSSGGGYDEDFGGSYYDNEFWGGTYNGEGIPKSWSAGLNFSNKYDDDKQNVNGSYRYYKLNSSGTGSTVSQSLLPGDNYFINRESSDMFSTRQRHTANGIYEWQMDSTTSAKVTASGYTGTSRYTNFYNSSTTNASGVQINSSNRINSAVGNNQNLNVNAIFRKKFKKQGRSFALNVNEIYNHSAADELIKADLMYFDNKDGSLVNDSITNQLKKRDNLINTLVVKGIYTEPVVKNLYLQANYGIRSNTNNSQLFSYDSTDEGKYTQLNNLYSNHYQYDVFTHTGGLAFRYNGKKLTGSAGTDVGFTHFYQKDVILDTAYIRNYTNFFPRVNFRYKFKTYTSLYLDYSGSTRQPSITQIQPVKDNTNPLFEYIGNTGLKQSFTHSMYMSFNNYNVFKQRSMYVNVSLSTTSNSIVTNQFTDTTTGKTTLQYVNTNGNYNYRTYIGFYGKLKKADINLNASANISGSKYSNIVNNADNTTQTTSPGFNLGLGKNKEKKYNIWYNGSFNYNFSKSSIQQSFTTNYWTQEHQFSVNVTLPWKFEINSDLDYYIRQKTPVFTSDNNVATWNAYIGRRLLKNDKAIIKIQGYDILNQNKGFSRDINSNTLTERTYQTIRRYFMLAFTWNFSKNPGGTTTPSN